MSWAASVAAGLVFACFTTGQFSLETLALPAVVPVAVIGSTVIAVLITPFVAWAMRTGPKNLYTYGFVLWVVAVIYPIWAVPRMAQLGFYSSVALTVCGLILLGFVPARELPRNE